MRYEEKKSTLGVFTMFTSMKPLTNPLLIVLPFLAYRSYFCTRAIPIIQLPSSSLSYLDDLIESREGYLLPYYSRVF